MDCCCKYLKGRLGHSKIISLARSFSEIVISYFLWFEISSPELHLPHLPSSVETLLHVSEKLTEATLWEPSQIPTPNLENNLLLFPSSTPAFLFQWRTWTHRLSVVSYCTCALGPIYSVLPWTFLNGSLTSSPGSSTSSSLWLLSISIHNTLFSS